MIGFATGIEANHKQLDKAATGQEVCVKIDAVPGEAPKLFGRHFTAEDMLCSKVCFFHTYKPLSIIFCTIPHEVLLLLQSVVFFRILSLNTLEELFYQNDQFNYITHFNI